MAYPSTGVKTFTPKVDLQSVVVANDVNQVYTEVTAIETHLGASGVSTSGVWGGAAPITTNYYAWGTLNSRLENIENGVYSALVNRVDEAGGSTITSSATSVIGLGFRVITSQTANVLEVKNAAGTANVMYVTPAGKVVASSINGGTP